ncbi:uncharacterized protein J4E78_000899 [Alternaria triticimaculans]|uniref:uncharacterized protein n=1 Tax=Alternaria triticimaculans TaxID=297637 RepID=UPI0020C22DA3|nr:uncharacterized protein J4E78_000899 [Alternaria triticimaculans]KAI4672398.1 hypothetical protein J4E78_000899 [Alternaria triticimaculans]
MASDTVASVNQKFNWADDDEDEFDLDSWNATVDTSAPTAAELGPLQVAPTGDDTKEGEVYTLSRISNERAYWDPLAIQESSDAEPTPEAEAEPVVEPPAEHWHIAVLSCSPEHQVMSARYTLITHAIGPSYEGKEESDVPAYPELSEYPGHRSYYARGFRDWKMKHRGFSSRKVYRNSPLNIVTSIDNAHEIDDIVDPEEGAVEDADREMNEEIDRMIDDQITNHIDQFQWFSRTELENFYHQFKAQEQKAETGDDVSDDDDSDSDDGWDQEAYEPYNGPVHDEEMSPTTTASVEDNETTFAITRPFADKEEELDFNNVVFGDDDSCDQSQSQDETDSEPSDEGYVSSSPPDTPFFETFNKADSVDAQNAFNHINARLSMSSRRRKTICRTESMDALNTFRQTAKFEQRVEDAFEDDEDDEDFGDQQENFGIDDELDTSSDVMENTEFVLVVTPPEDEQSTQDYLSSPATPLSSTRATVSASTEEDDQVISVKDESRGILNSAFTFPSISAGEASLPKKEMSTADTVIDTSKTSSRRWTDPPKYDPTLPNVSPSPSHRHPRHTKHAKHSSVSLDYVVGAVSKSWLYVGQVPWTQIGIMGAGVVAGGLLSMAGRT